MLITFTVFGEPAPQGSKRHVGNGVLIESSKKVKPWRDAVTAVARVARGANEPLLGPMEVVITFNFLRPKSVKRKRPCVYPDLDKLVRSTFDAITKSGLWKDDSQVCTLLAHKRYTNAEEPSAAITIRKIDHD